MSKHRLRPFLPESEIQTLVRSLAGRISKDYEASSSEGAELVVVVTLKGALFFAADLMRHLTIPVRMDFVQLASYGSGTKSSGTVRFLKDLETHPKGRHFLILDEIVDSGRTLKFLRSRIEVDEPESVRACTLLNKPSRREVDVEIDYIGRDVEDEFLVGYGLDFDERYRNLKDIYTVEGLD